MFYFFLSFFVWLEKILRILFLLLFWCSKCYNTWGEIWYFRIYLHFTVFLVNCKWNSSPFSSSYFKENKSRVPHVQKQINIIIIIFFWKIPRFFKQLFQFSYYTFLNPPRKMNLKLRISSKVSKLSLNISILVIFIEAM